MLLSTLAAVELDPWQAGMMIGAAVLVLIFVGGTLMFVNCFQKVEQGTCIVKTGLGQTKVSFSGMVCLPVVHRREIMDISLKRIEIYRHGSEGLICKDNVRADIKVAFFVRVNNVAKDVLQVAQSIGCKRASDKQALIDLFDAKFSEALKTVGKKFNFTELYTERDQFKDEILGHIGTDLNGYVLDDLAIDYLEQTEISQLDPRNILDAEGIKKITDLTAKEAVMANEIDRDKEKTIKKQNVEAREAILELEKQQAEAEAKKEKEVRNAIAREQAEANKTEEEERYKAEKARLQTEEELGVLEQTKIRQILVAERAKERADAVETERVLRERDLESTERERVVELARIEKEKALEIERKKIQDVIRERVVVERATVEERQRIKDTDEIMTAERAKQVQITAASATAETEMIKHVKTAEASKAASVFEADELLIEANAAQQAAEKEAEAKMKLAEARQAEVAAEGLAEAQVMDAKAGAVQNYGTAEAEVLRKKAEAEAAGEKAKAEAIEAQGTARADVLQRRYGAEADGVAAKADAMKKLNGVGKEHEEFKLRLDKDLKVELKRIDIEKDIAAAQAKVLGEALKSANIDIVGGDGQFFDQLIQSITRGKQVDRLVNNSDTIAKLGDALLSPAKANGENGHNKTVGERVASLVNQFGLKSADIKNLSIAALMGKMISKAGDDDGHLGELKKLLGLAKDAGIAEERLDDLIENRAAASKRN